MTHKTRIRIGIVLLDGTKILLVKMHRENAKDIYVLPGGGIHKGEDIFEAAIRETKEETNLDIKIKKILYLKSLYAEEENSLEIILLGQIKKGKLQVGYDPEEKGKNVLADVQFIELNELKNLNFHPKQIRTLLKKDHDKNFKDGATYLGNFKYPEN
ncbi:MAG: NUDIX hydrolase [Candidatus Woesearchaeota archaeon]